LPSVSSCLLEVCKVHITLFQRSTIFSIPHGDVFLFALSCCQILYAFLLRSDTLSRSYFTWIGQAAKVPLEVLTINKELLERGELDIASVDAILSIPDIHPTNKTDLLVRRAMSLLPKPDHGPCYAPCSAVHPTLQYCPQQVASTFFEVFTWMVPVYGALHFIPMLLFKRRQFFDNPWKMFLRTAWGTTRSSAFLGCFVSAFKAMFCGKHNLHAYLIRKDIIPRCISDVLVSRRSFWVMGFLTGLNVFIEHPKRRAELAMYVLPKSLESAWIVARGKGLVMNTGMYGDSMLAAIGMGMVMRAYQNDPQHLSGLVRRILYQFIGPN